jgi:hypothetical protein
MRPIVFLVFLLSPSVAAAIQPGFVKSTIPLNGTPVGLAFDADGKLFALEGAPFGSNDAILRTFLPDGTPNGTFPIEGDDSSNFFAGGMAYDPVGDQLLISDNAGGGQLYTVSKTGVQHTLATGIAGIAGVAVRSTGQIFVSAAPFGSPGSIIQVDRTTGGKSDALSGLALGAGLAFDGGDLIVQDAILLPSFETRGRLQRLPISGTTELVFGEPVPILDDMDSGYSVIVDSEGDLFTTGTGGLFQIAGTPLDEVPVLSSVFASATAFDPGPFEKFAGPGGGRLALAAEARFGMEDQFVTLLTPAEPGDYNADGEVNAADYDAWRTAYGSTDLSADGNVDGQVDAADYVIWRKHFQSAVQNSSATLAANVPEPMTLAPVLMALAATAANYRHLRNQRERAGSAPSSAKPTIRSLALSSART